MKKNNKGFTLAELLIVVAIIAVLVAIAIPVFTTQLEKSREATDLSNVRSAYAEAVAEYLANGATASTKAVVASTQQKVSGWQMPSEQAVLNTRVNGSESQCSVAAWDGNTQGWTVTVDASGSVTTALGTGGGTNPNPGP